MKKARFVASHELVVERFGLPPNTQVLSIGRDLNGDFVFVISNDDLPEVEEGATPPLVSPEFKLHWDWHLQGEQ